MLTKVPGFGSVAVSVILSYMLTCLRNGTASRQHQLHQSTCQKSSAFIGYNPVYVWDYGVLTLCDSIVLVFHFSRRCWWISVMFGDQIYILSCRYHSTGKWLGWRSAIHVPSCEPRTFQELLRLCHSDDGKDSTCTKIHMNISSLVGHDLWDHFFWPNSNCLWPRCHELRADFYKAREMQPCPTWLLGIPNDGLLEFINVHIVWFSKKMFMMVVLSNCWFILV